MIFHLNYFIKNINEICFYTIVQSQVIIFVTSLTFTVVILKVIEGTLIR